MSCALAIVTHSYYSAYQISYPNIFSMHDTDNDDCAEDHHQPDVEPKGLQPLVITFQKGDSLNRILCENRVSAQEADKIIKAIKRKFGNITFQIGQELTLEFAGSINDIALSKLSFRHLTDAEIVITAQENKQYLVEKKPFLLYKDVRFLSQKLDSSFSVSAKESGVPSKMIRTAILNLGNVVNIKNKNSTDDHFKFLYEVYCDKNGNFVKSGNILYLSIRVKNKEHFLYGFAKDGKNTEYYNHQGECTSIKSSLVRPLDGRVPITSKFNLKGRWHPIKGYKRAHKGVDYGACSGTPVLAAGPGVITQAGYAGGFGNTITITHNSGYKTVYAHLSKIKVKRGQYVKQRHHIGNVGSTGLSTGAHLHYEVLINNKHVNPLSVTKMPNFNLTGTDLNKFKQNIQKIKMEIKSKDAPTVYVTERKL
ncbi:MAG: hypothetical protein COY39_00865 [Alphaproteobacteria bacterium CG_4_10_14_0_8_um_filter_37_21]|nr:MAG: hypothetical protein COY39_00865 [Alphaproteobacteria bacterium CG_4_10_14_0_8_um_filter_37_21]